MCDHAAEKIAPRRIAYFMIFAFVEYAYFVRGSFLGVMYGCLRSSELERLVAPIAPIAPIALISWTSLRNFKTPTILPRHPKANNIIPSGRPGREVPLGERDLLGACPRWRISDNPRTALLRMHSRQFAVPSLRAFA